MATAQTRDIGIQVAAPARACQDPHCPFHGTLSVRGIVLDGRVASTKMERSVVVEREFLYYIPKYERFEKRTRRITAHHPPCIPLVEGDDVTVMECRPISKTKSFVVVEARKGALRVAGEDATAHAKPKAADEDEEKPAKTGKPAAAPKPKKTKGGEAA